MSLLPMYTDAERCHDIETHVVQWASLVKDSGAHVVTFTMLLWCLTNCDIIIIRPRRSQERSGL